MSRVPSSLFTRIAGLLAGTVALVLMIGLVVTRLANDGGANSMMAHSVSVQIAAADALIDHGDEAALGGLGIRRTTVAPAGHKPMLGVVRAALDDMRQRFPGREARIEGMRNPIVWIAARAPATGWIGISLSGGRVLAFRAGLVTIVMGGLLVLLLAGLYARSITAPLRRLAHGANDIVNGADPPSLPDGAARELVELRAALARAAADVRASARERDLMLAALSHDMRTPLARLRLGLELSPTAEPALRRGMEADIDALDALCEHFIAFARDGRDEPATALDLAALLREVIALSAVHGDPWTTIGPSSVSVEGKPLALRRALENLVRNATGHGAAPFRASIEITADEVLATVIDSGAGAPADVLERLGEPFVRGNPARSDANGSGLGLASVRRTAQQHGGTLRLRNLPGGGFAAMLALPRNAQR